MPGLIEGVQRSVAELEVAQIALAARVVPVADDERARAGLRSQDEVDDPSAEQLLRIEEAGCVVDVFATMPRHAAAGHPEAERVGGDRRFQRQLRSVGEGGNHPFLLTDGGRELALRLGRPVRVKQSLEVSCEHRLSPIARTYLLRFTISPGSSPSV